MRPGKARYQLWQSMLAIAVLAGLFAAFGVTGGVAIGIVAGVILLPILRARPGHRLRAAVWVSSLYPLLIVFSLYATWFTAWVVLGHRPRSSLDDPKFISPIVDVPYISTFVLMLGAPFSLISSWLLMLFYIAQNNEWRPELPGRRAALIFVPILVWILVFAIGGSGLFGIGYITEWYMD
jgi:hypothetical protein